MFLLPDRAASPRWTRPGRPFHDPEADAALFETIEGEVRDAGRVRRVDHHINDPEFAAAVVAALREVAHVRFARAELMARFSEMARRGEPIIGGGAGTGLSAKCEEAGGIDLIVIYNSGRYRMAGRGSLAGLLAYGNANEIVVEMAAEVLPVVRHTPVLAGVNGTDPFMLADHFLRELADLGLRRHPELPDRGPDRRRVPGQPGGDRHGLRAGGRPGRRRPRRTTCSPRPTCSSRRRPRDGRGRRRHHRGHMGLTTGGAIGAETAKSLDDCVALIDEWAAAARDVRADVLVLCHGGPIAMPDDAAYILRTPKHCHGFYGASSMERLPTEQALTAQTRAFKPDWPERKVPLMPRPYSSAVIPASADEVWGLVRDFNGLPGWHPAHRRRARWTRAARPRSARCAGWSWATGEWSSSGCSRWTTPTAATPT